MKRLIAVISEAFLCMTILMSLSWNATAQRGHLQHLSFEKAYGAILDGDVEIHLEVSLADLHLSHQDFMVLTPIVTSRDGAHEVKLPPIHLVGKTRAKVWKRAELFNHTHVVDGPKPLYSAVFSRSKAKQPINYHTTIPYETWMSDATLTIMEHVTGCAECDRWSNNRILKDTFLYQPHFNLLYVVPDVEAVKHRADHYSAIVNFRVDKANLDRNFMNNSEVLAEINEKVAKVVHNKDLKVSDIQIVGYASPEASASYNKELSERRSAAIADYLVNEFDIPRNMLVVSGYGEDWVKTRSEVASSDLKDKQFILDIIDSIQDPDERDVELKKLSDGATYARMLEEIYPRIRRTEYTLSYVVRGFEVEETKEVFKQNPKLLSLNEMYLLAKTYDRTSAEYKHVFDVAVKTYPTAPVAVINSGISMIQSGHYADALQTLLKVKDDPRAWHSLAVAYAYLYKYEEAKQYFEKAMEHADATISANCSEFQKVLKDQGMT